MYQIFFDRKNTISPLRAIRRIAEILCEEAGESGEDALRSCVEASCSLTIRAGRLHSRNWFKVTENDGDFEYHVLVALAYMN